MTRPYVTAFNRNRDFYQVPLALQERNLLGGLVTDFYAPSLGVLSQCPPLQRFAHRRVDGLPFSKVRWNSFALRKQLLALPRARSGSERVKIFKQIDKEISRAALRLALRNESDLFLYSGYAQEAFEAPEAASLRKGLFVFHPHGRLSLEILENDLEEHPEAAESHRWHRAEIDLSDSERLDAETKSADFLVCASSFTAKSLAHAHATQQATTIAPYGCFPTDSECFKSRNRELSFLFVGQGVQRKGLHHLLKIWRRLKLPDATLTIVASSFDPGFRSLADFPSVRVLSSQTAAELRDLYRRADVFVMPSLIEGFGLVYLEALAAGCFVIGTENSGLPDLRLPPECGRILPAGNLNALENALEDSFLQIRNRAPTEICSFANRCSWSDFRRTIAEACA